MTNEERHIAVLNRMLENMDVYDSIQPTTERKKAIKAAIKALEQEPSGDLISRQAVIDACEQSINILEAVDRIMDLPSAEQEPPTGYWSHDGSHWKNRFICSECGYKLFDEPTNYCPNCGSAMKEE